MQSNVDALVGILSSCSRAIGATLEQEERIQAREAELECISAQAELGTQEEREKRTRDIAPKQRAEFQKRAASVDPQADPERDDSRAELTQEELAAVNKQSMRLAEKLDGWSRAAIGRQLGEAVADGEGLTSAVVGLFANDGRLSMSNLVFPDWHSTGVSLFADGTAETRSVRRLERKTDSTLQCVRMSLSKTKSILDKRADSITVSPGTVYVDRAGQYLRERTENASYVVYTNVSSTAPNVAVLDDIRIYTERSDEMVDERGGRSRISKRRVFDECLPLGDPVRKLCHSGEMSDLPR